MFCYLDTLIETNHKYLVAKPTGFRFLVGFFAPDGKFVCVKGFDNQEQAEAHTSYLNGGNR